MAPSPVSPHPTATAKDEDSVQCLDCSLIEDEVGKKCIQNESAKDIKLSDVAWPSFILDLPRGDNRSLVDDQEKFPGVSSFNPDFIQINFQDTSWSLPLVRSVCKCSFLVS